MKKEGKIKENNHCLKGLRAYHTNACKKLDGTTDTQFVQYTPHKLQHLYACKWCTIW